MGVGQTVTVDGKRNKNRKCEMAQDARGADHKSEQEIQTIHNTERTEHKGKSQTHHKTNLTPTLTASLQEHISTHYFTAH